MGTSLSQPSKRKKKSKRTQGIFCLEGEWGTDLRKRQSIEPVLTLLHNLSPHMPHVHRDAATRDEFFFFLKKWTQTRYRNYPILYVAYHGGEGEIYVGDWRETGATITLDDIAERLEGLCKNRIIMFGSCETFNVDRRHLTRFLRTTDALALCGYREPVDVILAAAFELIVLSALGKYSLTRRGASAMERHIRRNSKELVRSLGFRMVAKP